MRTPPTLPNPTLAAVRGSSYGTLTAVRDIMTPSTEHADGQGSGEEDGREAVPGVAAGDLVSHEAGAAAVRDEGVRLPGPGRDERRARHLPGLVRRPAHRNVPSERRHLAVPARRRPGGPLPALLPFLHYATAFFVLACVTDLAVLALLAYAGRRPGRTLRGAWVWVAGVPLLGPTVYARYDVMVTAVAVAALLAGARHPKTMGALAAFGALLKVWPAMLLLAARRRSAWMSALVTGIAVTGAFALAMPGGFAFLTFQRDRGTEVESLGALVFHVARHFGWQGEVRLNYGSIEFSGRT
ncbi:hypothetical protein GCM10011428_38770 [Streptomyces violaceus]